MGACWTCWTLATLVICCLGLILPLVGPLEVLFTARPPLVMPGCNIVGAFLITREEELELLNLADELRSRRWAAEFEADMHDF